VQTARETHETVSKARRDLWSELRTATTRLGLNINQDVVLYDLDAQASFTYNAYAGMAWYEVILPTGVKAEAGKVKSSLHGNYSVPDIDPKAAIAQMGFVKTTLHNSYTDWAARKARNDRYVYVASKRFVDTVALENLLQEAVWAVVTAGQTAKGSLEVLKEQLLLEWADIVSWLREAGIEKYDELAADIAKAVLENGLKATPIPLRLSLPGRVSDISVNVEVINYEYEITPTVQGELKKVLSLIGYDSDKVFANLGERVPVPHLTFSLSIPKPRTHSSAQDEQLLLDFVDLLQKGPAVDIGDLADKISGLSGIDLGSARAFRDVDGNESMRAAFAQALSNAVAEARTRHKGGGVFDFTDSSAAKELEARLRGLTIGNAKEAKVKRLVIDTASASVNLDVDLTSKHRLFRVDILRELDALWTKKDEQESKVFNDAFDAAKMACDKVAETCQSLSRTFTLSGTFRISPNFCGSSSQYQNLALEPLSRPVSPPSSAPSGPRPDDNNPVTGTTRGTEPNGELQHFRTQLAALSDPTHSPPPRQMFPNSNSTWYVYRSEIDGVRRCWLKGTLMTDGVARAARISVSAYSSPSLVMAAHVDGLKISARPQPTLDIDGTKIPMTVSEDGNVMFVENSETEAKMISLMTTKKNITLVATSKSGRTYRFTTSLLDFSRALRMTRDCE
jgi:hypothetical protein